MNWGELPPRLVRVGATESRGEQHAHALTLRGLASALVVGARGRRLPRYICIVVIYLLFVCFSCATLTIGFIGNVCNKKAPRGAVGFIGGTHNRDLL